MSKTVLITGISGYVAKQTAISFLEAGYRVRGTLRTPARADDIKRIIGRYADAASLGFVQADLLSDTGWDEAMAGCDGVVHMASPFPLAQPRDAEELIRPAVDGTLRVLRAALRNKVGRVVQTSSSVAVHYGHEPRSRPYTEDDWTDLSTPSVTPYQRSKTMAERAAREFVAGEGSALRFSSVNPGFVLGPVLDSDISSSVEVIRMFLTGKYPGMPRLQFPVVDVRDVAKAHLRAMEAGAPGGRYLAFDESLWFADMGRAIKAALGARARKVPGWELPNFAVRLVALYDPAARAILPELGRDVRIDNSRTRAALGMDFIPAREAAVASAKSLIELGLA